MLKSYSSVSRDKLGKSIKTVTPQIKDLLFTSRTKVEILKVKCVSIEKDFQQSRHELKKCENELEMVKRDLQTLYTLRANEYIKPKQEQRVKEINENENRLNEQERQMIMAVTSARQREENHFESFRSTNDLLYHTSLVYANRFIILGVGIGIIMMGWRAWSAIREKGVAPSDTSPINNVMIDKEGSEIRNGIKHTNTLLQELVGTQNSRFGEVREMLAKRDNSAIKNSEIQRRVNDISIKMDDYLEQTTGDVNGQFDHKMSALILGIVGGIVGATVAMVFVQR